MNKTNRLIALFFLLFTCFKTAIAQSPLEYASAELVSAPLEYKLDGAVEAAKQATLSSEVSGRIVEINFDVGDHVKQGEVIIRIRDNEYRARLEKAKAALAEAQSGYDDASREFKRVQGLLKNNVISRAGFDKASANVDAMRARVAAGQASVREAQEQLDNTVIQAPYSGIVVERYVELGESTSSGQPIMSGYAIGEFRVNVDVPQSIINAVRKHRSARVLVLENEQFIESSKLTIFPYADPLNHSFKVRLDLPKTEADIFPGMLVKALFVIEQSQRLMIPVNALVRRSEVVGVYVINDDQQVSFRQVRPGIANIDTIEINAGLEVGERVALNPVNAGIRLKENWKSQQ